MTKPPPLFISFIALFSNRPVPLTASPSPSPSPAQFFLDLTLQNPKPETQVWGTTPVSRLRLFMMLRGRDNFNKKYLIKFRTNDKLKLITCFNCSTLKCEIEVIKRKNVCVYLVLQSVSVVRLQLLPLLRPLIVYLISPLQTPRRAQPGSSTTSSMHDQHHWRFYSKKSLGHQMVACMTRTTF